MLIDPHCAKHGCKLIGGAVICFLLVWLVHEAGLTADLCGNVIVLMEWGIVDLRITAGGYRAW